MIQSLKLVIPIPIHNAELERGEVSQPRGVL
jgi:hypothetical protein